MSLELRGKRVTVMGLGRHGGGIGAARFLASQGAQVTVSDSATAEELRESLSALADVPLARLSLGGHQEEDFHGADLVVVNPAVRPDSPWLTLIERAGIATTSEIELFLAHCPGRVIGVTGSNGKSTTAAMIDHLLRSAGARSHLGGNFGGSLLASVGSISREDWVVLELSSFQLARLRPVRSIDIAVVLNCTPNHLDWHGDFPSYARAKQQLLALQDEQGIAILNWHNREVDSWRGLVRGRCADPSDHGRVLQLPLAGVHQRQNAACALAAAIAAGCDAERAHEALTTFVALPHRLQLIAEVNGRRFYDDSKATTPEATIAAAQTIVGPLWLLTGGVAKVTEFDSLALAIASRAAGVACFGRDGQWIQRALLNANPHARCSLRDTLAAAVRWCWAGSQAGDAIVLSPACASFDQYADYVARADDFAGRVEKLRQKTIRPRRRRYDRETGSRSGTSHSHPATPAWRSESGPTDT